MVNDIQELQEGEAQLYVLIKEYPLTWMNVVLESVTVKPVEENEVE